MILNLKNPYSLINISNNKTAEIDIKSCWYMDRNDSQVPFLCEELAMAWQSEGHYRRAVEELRNWKVEAAKEEEASFCDKIEVPFPTLTTY